jgi:hypothetical protein
MINAFAFFEKKTCFYELGFVAYRTIKLKEPFNRVLRKTDMAIIDITASL